MTIAESKPLPPFQSKKRDVRTQDLIIFVYNRVWKNAYCIANLSGEVMHIKKIALTVLLLTIPLLAETKNKEPIALSDLTPQGSIDASAAAAISDRLRNELFKTDVFTVVERGQMQEILKEQGFQQSGCTSDACAVEIGQLLGVKYIVVGSIAKVGATYTLNARIVDVATGKIVHTANSDCRCEIDDVLLKSTVDIAKNLASSVKGPQIKVEQPKKKSRLGIRLSFGGGAFAALIAGYYFNAEAEKNIDEANKKPFCIQCCYYQ